MLLGDVTETSLPRRPMARRVAAATGSSPRRPARQRPVRPLPARPLGARRPDGAWPIPVRLRPMNRVDERFASMGGEARVRLESGDAGDERAAGARRARARADRRRSSAADPVRRSERPVALQRGLRASGWRPAAGARARARGALGADDERRAGGRDAARASSSARATRRRGAGARRRRWREALAGRPGAAARRGRSRRAPVRVRRGGPASCGGRRALRLDSGGLGKGIAADLAARLVPDGVRYAISCGGDLAVGPADWRIAVTSAFTGEEVHRLGVRRGGVATSGIQRRLWRGADGDVRASPARPLDRAAGVDRRGGGDGGGRSALEAEVLAKTALLSGPDGARGGAVALRRRAPARGRRGRGRAAGAGDPARAAAGAARAPCRPRAGRGRLTASPPFSARPTRSRCRRG